MANPIDIPQDFSTTLNVGGGIDASQTTGIVLTSVSGLPTDGGILCFDWASPLDTSAAEYLEYTGISGNTLTGVTRGAEGFSGHAHTNGCTVVGIVSRAHIKRLRDKLTGNDAVALQDTSANELLKTSPVASAVNEITIANAATGNAPSLAPTGADTNIDFILKAKGAGNLKFGTALLKFPNADGSANQALITDGAGVLSFGSVAGGLHLFATSYSPGNIIVAPDLAAPYIVQEAITLATIKIYLKDGPNTGATATIVPKRNSKKLFTTAPTIAASTQKDAMDATTGWAGTGVTVTNDTSIKKEGTGSLKNVIDATGNRTLDKTIGSFDASTAKAISFWIGSNAANVCRFYITDGTNTSYFNIDNVPLVSAANLNFARVYLTSEKLNNPDANSGTKCNIAAITHIGFDTLTASQTYYIDDIELENYYTGTPDITALAAGDILSTDVTVVGSTLSGAGLVVEYYK